MLLRAVHTFQDHSGPIYGLCPGRSADTVFTASGDRFVVEWNIRTLQQERFAVKLEHPAYKVLFISEFNLLIIGNSIGGLHVIDTTTKKELRYFTTHTNGIYDIQCLVYARFSTGQAHSYLCRKTETNPIFCPKQSSRHGMR